MALGAHATDGHVENTAGYFARTEGGRRTDRQGEVELVSSSAQELQSVPPSQSLSADFADLMKDDFSSYFKQYKRGGAGGNEHVPGSAARCKTASQLKAWYTQEKVRIGYVPKEWRKAAEAKLDRQYKTNMARLRAEQEVAARKAIETRKGDEKRDEAVRKKGNEESDQKHDEAGDQTGDKTQHVAAAIDEGVEAGAKSHDIGEQSGDDKGVAAGDADGGMTGNEKGQVVDHKKGDEGVGKNIPRQDDPRNSKQHVESVNGISASKIDEGSSGEGNGVSDAKGSDVTDTKGNGRREGDKDGLDHDDKSGGQGGGRGGTRVGEITDANGADMEHAEGRDVHLEKGGDEAKGHKMGHKKNQKKGSRRQASKAMPGPPRRATLRATTSATRRWRTRAT